MGLSMLGQSSCIISTLPKGIIIGLILLDELVNKIRYQGCI